jgi:hypothetical protein
MVKITGVKKTLLELRSFADRAVAEQLSRKTASLVSELRDATPVDTGRARDGWYASGGAICNDVEYVDDLNRGTSRQAPPYFIEKTLLLQPGVSPNGTIVTEKQTPADRPGG